MLFGLKDVTYRIGLTVLLDQVNFSLEERECVALVGRNGTGKSTLFRLITGEINAEDGLVVRREGLRVASLQQEVPQAQTLTVEQVVCEGLGKLGEAWFVFRRLSEIPFETLDQDAQDRLTASQHVLDEAQGWDCQSRIDQVLGRFKLNGADSFASLSGGMKRKVLLAKAWVSDPDVLLLDEPTNHLDIPSIELLEEQIRQFKGSVMLVSHDRAFMRKLATRVCDLDRGHLKSWSNGYEGYLKGKADFLAAEEKQNELFDKRLAEEEVWIRRGIEARRTRNEGRVRALKEMRRQFADRRNRQGQAKIEVHEAQRSGKIVAEIENLSLTLGTQPILCDFSTVILRGEKIGVLGPNGIGKTTALRAILGEIQADRGTVKLGTKLEVAYFDQLRSGFNEAQTAVDVIGAGKEFIQINGQAKHVIGYLQDFLFTPDRARQPVRSLSGGERARLLLAQLFARASNLLVLDEPTNDLDIETLELLEEKLDQYEGTVLLVSHDREFIDRIVTRCWVFEGGGQVQEYVGGYEDWLRQRETDPWARTPGTPSQAISAQPAQLAQGTQATQATQSAQAAQATQASISSDKPRKLSYKENRELEELPALIEQLEQKQAEHLRLIGDPDFYSRPAAEITSVQEAMSKIEMDLEKAYARWDELENQRQGYL